MVVQILQNMARSIGGVARETGQFRQAAAQQNKSISSFIKDISKMFMSQNKQQSSISSSLDDIQYQSQQTSGKVDTTNSLLQESISLQTQMLSQLTNISSSISSLLAAAGGGEGGGFGFKSLAAAGAIGTAAGFLGGYGLNTLSGMGIDTGGSSFGGGSSSATGGGSADTGGGDSGEKLSVASMVKLAKDAGFNDEQAVIMGAIGAAESSGRTRAHNPNASTGDNSYGLWQINMLGRMGPERRKQFGIESNEQLWDPNINAKAAKSIFDQQGFKAWSVYKSGAYKKYLGTARESLNPRSEEQDDGNNQDQIQRNNTKSGAGDIVQKQSAIAGGAVTYANQNATRNKPIQPRLMSILQGAARETGVDVEIFSGGQPPKGSGGKRTGSTRHDNGNAADVRLKKDGKKVTDRETIAKFIAASSKLGATGIGHGPGYMEAGAIHVGFGNPAVWGAGGRGANAPAWVRSAAKGIYDNKNLASNQDTGTRSQYGQAGGGASASAGMQTDALASMGGTGMPDLGGLGLGGIGSAVSFLSGIGGNIISGLTGIGSSSIFGSISDQISSLSSGNQNGKPKKESDQSPTETFLQKTKTPVAQENQRTEQLAEASSRATLSAIPKADVTQQSYAADPVGYGDQKTSVGVPGEQLALNGAKDDLVLASWYTNLYGKGGGNIVPDSDFYEKLA